MYRKDFQLPYVKEDSVQERNSLLLITYGQKSHRIYRTANQLDNCFGNSCIDCLKPTDVLLNKALLYR